MAQKKHPTTINREFTAVGAKMQDHQVESDGG